MLTVTLKALQSQGYKHNYLFLTRKQGGHLFFDLKRSKQPLKWDNSENNLMISSLILYLIEYVSTLRYNLIWKLV